MADSSRKIAYQTLLAAEKNSAHAIDELLSEALNKCALSPQEKRWTMELVYGVTRMKLQIDGWVESVYKGRYRKAQHAIKTLLRIGVFQLKYMQTSEHAAINETVALCKTVKQAGATGLVNAVLRHLQGLELPQILATYDDALKKLSIETSHPEWLLEKWQERYKTSDLMSLCTHNNLPPKIWVRRNASRVDQAGFETYLAEENIEFERSSILESFYTINSGGSLLTTQEFSEGWFSFQDLAAGIVATIVDAAAGDVIVDACAAPGGKMALMSEVTRGRARIIACDASETRLEKVKQNVKRLGLEQIEVCQIDAATDKIPIADKMLLDVPCSGTGVLSRRPDARWRRQVSDTTSFTKIQSGILRNCWESLKPGGLMVYATCTLEPEENWELIDSQIDSLVAAEIEPIQNENLKAYIDERGALATLPWRDSMDGMFAVKIRKRL
ncbi:MAG: 16S rRNA (cytosine(967)-C(5))-methyltransferase RsmB [Candidatus Marinimicrobia bacterium]|nr:16S rRNA (cytosine(967)-C(5))-methyltransferase RsmB [Candidatus Neomarinimicrobiota bacterium]